MCSHAECAIPAKQQLVPLYAAADREEVKVYLKRDSLPPNKRSRQMKGGGGEQSIATEFYKLFNNLS